MYLGHSTLEQLVARIKSEHTLYLNLLEEHFPSPDSIDLLRASLLAQTRVWNGREHDLFYWKMPIGDVLAPGGTPWPEEISRVRAAGKSALKALKQFLTAQPNVKGIEEGAVIAMPRDLKLLFGSADCLTFDKQSGTFHLKEGCGFQEQTSAMIQRQEAQ